MSKFTCLVLCAVAVSLGSVYAEEKCVFQAIKPMIAECATEQGVSDADIQKAKDTKSIDDLKPCFIGCVFKKFGLLNSKGEYDADAALAKVKDYVKNDDFIAKFTDIMKNCQSVNDQTVSDGEAGCERAVLLANCFKENKFPIPM